MCGIFGFTGRQNQELLKKMAFNLKHRGPDGEGFYTSGGINLGHRRLAIVDLKSGDQPLFSEDRSIVLIANTEIYNHNLLRKELEKKGHIFKTNSDCEVIIHAYEQWPENFIDYLNGDFAFALWDDRQKQLMLVRDRLGIRPLYYCIIGEDIIFASETKAILLDKRVPRDLDEISLGHYLSLRYVPGEKTMFKAIKRLLPARKLVFKNGEPAITCYWHIDYQIDNTKSLQSWTDEFLEIFSDTVHLRLMSDVGYGAFLSGGLDSSAVVSMMKKHSSSNITTYAVGFGCDIDETGQASEVANLLDTCHRSWQIPADSYKLLPKIIYHLDEPIGDAIVIPTYLLSKESSANEKVILSGEGADEILAGYVHHLTMNSCYKLNRKLALCLASLIQAVPCWFIDHIFPYPAQLGKSGRRRLVKYLSNLNRGVRSYLTLVELFTKEEKDNLYSHEEFRIDSDSLLFNDWQHYFNDSKHLLNQSIDLDINNWLSNYTLYKQDRLTMANSQEGRVPFLDHRLVELCAKLPIKFKINNFQVKFLLRQAAKKILPKEIANSKKKAFYLPTEKVFGDDFNSFVRSVLLEGELTKFGIFHRDAMKNYLKDFQKTEILPNKKVIALLILGLWMDNYLKEVLSN